LTRFYRLNKEFLRLLDFLDPVDPVDEAIGILGILKGVDNCVEIGVTGIIGIACLSGITVRDLFILWTLVLVLRVFRDLLVLVLVLFTLRDPWTSTKGTLHFLGLDFRGLDL
jgi:hypothetical protein